MVDVLHIIERIVKEENQLRNPPQLQTHPLTEIVTDRLLIRLDGFHQHRALLRRENAQKDLSHTQVRTYPYRTHRNEGARHTFRLLLKQVA